MRVKCFWLSAGHLQGFSCILGTSEQSVGCRRGVGVEKNNTCNYLACALFTITEKHIFYVCLTNTVQKKTHTNKILRLCSLGGWRGALSDDLNQRLQRDHV